MKYIEVRKGEDFSLFGTLLRLVRFEGSSVVLYDIRKKKNFTYGFDALQRIVRRGGYKIIREDGENGQTNKLERQEVGTPTGPEQQRGEQLADHIGPLGGL